MAQLCDLKMRTCVVFVRKGRVDVLFVLVLVASAGGKDGKEGREPGSGIFVLVKS